MAELEGKSLDQLQDELAAARQRVAELEALVANHGQAEGSLHVPAERPSQKTRSDPRQKRLDADAIFINELRKHSTSVQLFLVNGACLSGKIEAFSPFALILRSQNRQQLIQKGSIISIRPQKAGILNIFKTSKTKGIQPDAENA